MASAVLANSNEAHWGERKVYMKNYTKTPIPMDHNNTKNLSHFNRNPNPSPNFNHAKKQIHEHAVKPNNEPSPRVPLPSATEFHRKPITGIAHNDAFRREYVTFNLSMYTQNDKKELKSRLVLELALLNRIQTREIVAMDSPGKPQKNLVLSRLWGIGKKCHRCGHGDLATQMDAEPGGPGGYETFYDYVITPKGWSEELLTILHYGNSISSDCRNALLIVAVLIATVNFQTVVQPPSFVASKDHKSDGGKIL